MRPVFITKNVTNTPWSKIVKEQHVRFVVKNENVTLTGIGFNLAEKFSLLQMNKPVDLVYTLDENEWNGEKHLQLKVIDVRISECDTA
jgi:single-stranded-DNA-specific exonuclease